MSRELSNCYEVLGVVEGASAQELKVAYRDLAKVWHPDRFAHDPRLQQKAQEKLKEINEAYEQLTSGNIRFRKRASGGAQQPTQQNTPRATRRFVVLPACVFTFVLLVSGSLLLGRRESPPQNPAQEVESSNVEQPSADSASDTLREQRAARKPIPKQLSTGATKEPTVGRAAGVTPPPTVTLTIDPTTGLIANAGCPIKSSMTYADGTEPRQHCSSHTTGASARADPPLKESHLKSLTKRLASPSKWFRGKEKSGSSQPETPASNNTGNQN
jgi:hypothetical protein